MFSAIVERFRRYSSDLGARLEASSRRRPRIPDGQVCCVGNVVTSSWWRCAELIVADDRRCVRRVVVVQERCLRGKVQSLSVCLESGSRLVVVLVKTAVMTGKPRYLSVYTWRIRRCLLQVDNEGSLWEEDNDVCLRHSWFSVELRQSTSRT